MASTIPIRADGEVSAPPTIRPRLTCRTVKRWYWQGKGYATKRLACRAMAKRELNGLIYRAALDFILAQEDSERLAFPNREDIHAEYAVMFPLHPHGTALWAQHSGPGYSPKAFCNKCRWAWLNKRTDELLEQFKEIANG